jgi:hypothetical protein
MRAELSIEGVIYYIYIFGMSKSSPLAGALSNWDCIYSYLPSQCSHDVCASGTQFTQYRSVQSLNIV